MQKASIRAFCINYNLHLPTHSLSLRPSIILIGRDVGVSLYKFLMFCSGTRINETILRTFNVNLPDKKQPCAMQTVQTRI